MITILKIIALYLGLSFGGAWIDYLFTGVKFKKTLIKHLLIWIVLFGACFVLIYSAMKQ